MAAKGLLLALGIAQMYTTSDIARPAVCLGESRAPVDQRLYILVFLEGQTGPTVAPPP